MLKLANANSPFYFAWRGQLGACYKAFCASLEELAYPVFGQQRIPRMNKSYQRYSSHSRSGLYRF